MSTDLETLYRKTRQVILPQALAKVRDRDLADDLTQDVMLELCRKYSHLEELDDLVPVAAVILRYKATAERRKSYRRRASAPLVDPETAAIQKELRALVPVALRRLSPELREVLGRQLQGESLKEIIESSGLPSGTVYARSSRGLQALRRELREMRLRRPLPHR